MNIYEKSQEILKRIIDAQGDYQFSIVLIGGWAAWVYNPYMMSRDIDIIVSKEDLWKLRDFLFSFGFSESHSEHLGETGFAMLYEGDKVDVDVYSEKIANIPVEGIYSRAVRKKLNGKVVFVPHVTDLLILKLQSAIDRCGSGKGEKDLADILAIIDKCGDEIQWDRVRQSVDERELKRIIRILFRDVKFAQRTYNIEFKRFHKLKKAFKRLGFM